MYSLRTFYALEASRKDVLACIMELTRREVHHCFGVSWWLCCLDIFSDLIVNTSQRYELSQEGLPTFGIRLKILLSIYKGDLAEIRCCDFNCLAILLRVVQHLILLVTSSWSPLSCCLCCDLIKSMSFLWQSRRLHCHETFNKVGVSVIELHLQGSQCFWPC